MSNYTLYLGDCLEYMRTMPDKSVDVVITDPPYGVDASTGWSKELYGETAVTWNGGSIIGDDNTSLRDKTIKWCKDRNIPLAVFGSANIPEPEDYLIRLIWDKGESAGMGDLTIPWKPNYDYIHIYGRCWRGRRTSSVLRVSNIPRISMGRKHPHEKPIELMMHLIIKTPKSCTIFDPFMGSGTTGVACMQLGRNFIGCEIDEKYYKIAEKRIKQAAMQEPLFV